MNINYIRLVAHYERVLLRRNLIFTIFTLFIIGCTLSFHIYFHSEWNVPHPPVNIPAVIPFTNAYLFSILQALAVIFLVGDFINQHKKKSTNDVFLTRPASAGEYVIGKTLAIIEMILLIDLLVIILAMTIHLFASNFSFDFSHYLFYLLTLTFPAILFMTGLSLALKILIKNAWIASLILFIFWGASISVLPPVGHGILDFIASEIPNVFSSITGHPGIDVYLLQRSIFILFSGVLISVAITKLPHFSEHKGLSKGPVRALLLFVGGVVIASSIYSLHFKHNKDKRTEYSRLYRQVALMPKINTVEHEIIFKREKNRYEATSLMTIVNRTPRKTDTLLLYLNPALEVTELTLNGQKTPFQRKEQLILVDAAMEPRDSARMVVNYKGKIDPLVCYPDISNEEFFRTEKTEYILSLGRHFAFLGDKFTLLTPECLWYPTTIPTVNFDQPFNNQQDFTLFKLKVISAPQRTVISQGEMTLSGDTACFNNKYPLTGIILSEGDMARDTVKTSITRWEFYNKKGHYPLRGALNASDSGRIKGCEGFIHVYLEQSTCPFHKLACIETPRSFHSFSRPWTPLLDYIHPEIILMPEQEDKKPIDYPQLLKFYVEEHKQHWLTMQRLESIQITRNGTLFFPKAHRTFSLLVQEQNLFVNSTEFPVMNRVIQWLNTGLKYREKHPSEALSLKTKNDMEAIEYLTHKSLKEALEDPGTQEVLQDIIRLKSFQLQDHILLQTSWPDFNLFLDGFSRKYRFKEVSFDQFTGELNTNLGINILPLVENWFIEQGVPAFYIKDIKPVRTQINQQGKIFLNFKVWNRSRVAGVVSVEENLRGFRHIQGRLIHPDESIEIYYLLKDSVPPDKMERPLSYSFCLNTNYSRNLPENFGITSFGDIVPEVNPSDIQDIRPVDTLMFLAPTNEIIVDDTDPGFRIIQEELPFFQKLRKQPKKYNYISSNIPHRWTRAVENGAYGDILTTCFCKTGGAKSTVEWNAEIKEGGTYELFIYLCQLSASRGHQELTYDYTFDYNGKTERILLDLTNKNYKVRIYHTVKNEEERAIDYPLGWISLGKYTISPGNVKLTLHDKGLSAGQVLVVDAAKWVKRE